MSYAELDAAAVRTARRLAAHGVGPGDRVATILPPSHAFVELLHALPKLGAALVPLSPRLIRDERRLRREGTRLLVERPVEGPEAEVRLRNRIQPDETHSIIYTSGTTGAPKPVELSYANHHASATASARNLRLDRDDRWLSPLPLFHVGGLAVLLRSVIHATTAVIHDGFEAAAVARELASGRATLVSLVPTMLHRLLEAGLERAPGLRAAVLGGGPVAPELLERAGERGLPVVATYGMTETASQIVAAAAGEAAGRPLPGVEVEIAGDGEILVRGPMVSRAAVAGDGWLHTGDRGWIDDQGRLHVEGRLDELIVTGGENVSPVEVEHVLLAHDAVADAAVVGLPDPEWGQAVSAFLVLRGAAAPAELIDWCRERLPPHKVPKRVERVPALPRNAAGKLLREALVPGAESYR